jgi:hypothetical protein
MAHRTHRRAGVCFREEAQEWGLGEFDFEGSVQRVVEEGIACLIYEVREENYVSLSQHRPGEIDAPCSEGGNNEAGSDTSRNDNAALVPFSRWRYGENWRRTLFDRGRGPGAVFDPSDEAVAAARDRLNKSRFLGVIPQGFPQALYRSVNAVLELDHGAVRPEPLPDLLARDELARLLQ